MDNIGRSLTVEMLQFAKGNIVFDIDALDFEYEIVQTKTDSIQIKDKTTGAVLELFYFGEPKGKRFNILPSEPKIDEYLVGELVYNSQGGYYTIPQYYFNEMKKLKFTDKHLKNIYSVTENDKVDPLIGFFIYAFKYMEETFAEAACDEFHYEYEDPTEEIDNVELSAELYDVFTKISKDENFAESMDFQNALAEILDDKSQHDLYYWNIITGGLEYANINPNFDWMSPGTVNEKWKIVYECLKQYSVGKEN